MNIGVLSRPNRKLKLGGVIKTPFKANIKHEYTSASIEEYPENPGLNIYTPISFKEDLTFNRDFKG